MRAGWAAAAGERVVTRSFGPAVVLRLTGTGALVQLTDYGDLEVEVLLSELAPLGADPAVVEAPLSPTTTVSSNGKVTARPVREVESTGLVLEPAEMGGSAEARKSVEALRFGLVPDRHIAELTLGMEELDAWTRARLPSAHDGRPLASAINGPFGTGKSHTMAVVRHIARREGYAVARVEVDGQTVSLSSPPKLLNRLWSTLGASDLESFTPVLDLYLKAIRQRMPAPTVAPRGIDRIQHNYEVVSIVEHAGKIETHRGLIEGLLTSSEEVTANQARAVLAAESSVRFYEFSPKAMIGKRVADRPYDFVEVLAGHAMVAQRAGYKGLVITVDEFEVERNLTPTQYARVDDLLHLLTTYFAGELEYELAPLALFFATVGGRGHEGDAAIDAMLAGAADGEYELTAWAAGQRSQLSERLHRLYCSAYADRSPFDPSVVDRVEGQLARYGDEDSGMIRAFIKRYVAALDSALGPPAA